MEITLNDEDKTKNSIFDNSITLNIIPIEEVENMYNRLYDTIYNNETRFIYNIDNRIINPNPRDNHNNIIQIIIYSFIINTDFFFRMFPEEYVSELNISQRLLDIISYIQTNMSNIINYIKNDDLQALLDLFVEIKRKDSFIFDNIVSIHLNNLYHFPYEVINNNNHKQPTEFKTDAYINNFINTILTMINDINDISNNITARGKNRRKIDEIDEISTQNENLNTSNGTRKKVKVQPNVINIGGKKYKNKTKKSKKTKKSNIIKKIKKSKKTKKTKKNKRKMYSN